MNMEYANLPPAPHPRRGVPLPLVSKATSVRIAAEADAGTVLKLFVENLCPIAHFKPSISAMAVALYQLVVRGQVFVAELNGEMIGCAAYVVLRPWYLDVDQMYEQGAFVVPEHRKGPAIARLIAALTKESKRRGLDLIMIANTKNVEAAPLLAKRYKKTGEMFVLEVA